LHNSYLKLNYIELSRSELGLYLLLAGGAGMTYVTMHFIRKSLCETLCGVNRELMAMNSKAGDLTARLNEITQDDIGRLSCNFNELMEFLRTSLSAIKASSQRCRDIGADLALNAKSASEATSGISAEMEALRERSAGLLDQAREQGHAVEAANAELRSFLGHIEVQAEAVEKASSGVESMAATLKRIEDSTKGKAALTAQLKADGAQGDEIVREIASTISGLSQSADAIRDFVGVINGISQQTGLLAMNASIEAAHAGEAGKGFAVVAEEIRKLATSTADNSGDISKSLGTVAKAIERSAELSTATEAILEKIVEGIGLADAATNETLESLSGASRVGGELVGRLGELSSLTLEIRDSGKGIGGQMAALEGAVERVSSLAADNERSVAGVTERLSEIARAAAALSELGVANAENTRRLEAEAAKYKIS
jgi:methyl-accepting chemotaxis protein